VGAAALIAAKRRAYAYYVSPRLNKYIQPLRGILPTEPGAPTLPVAQSDGTRVWTKNGATVTAQHYTIEINQFEDQLYPSSIGGVSTGFGPTKLFGYGQPQYPGVGFRHLGPLIVAQKNVPVQITFVNKLPPTHILPVDSSGFFGDAQTAHNKAAVHLHGGYVPWISDGGPYDWWTPAQNGADTVGPSFSNDVLLPGGQHVAGQAEYYYPNQQSSRLVWYHDHAHDLTRLNAYAGIASAYVIRDDFENALIAARTLPSLSYAAEIPLVFQDKVFVGADIAAIDPGWTTLPVPQTPGSLWYPHTYEPLRWTLAAGSPAPEDPSVVAEMFGDTMLVNGTVYPYLNVERRRYRFRVLNACNARFVNLQLYYRDNSADGITPQLLADGTVAPTNQPGPPIVQIGTECGFLPAPVVLNNPPKPMGFNPATGNANRYTLLMAPGERADIVIDFAGVAAGSRLILWSDAPAPFPGGDPGNDFYWDDQDPGQVVHPEALQGPNTRTLMEFRVQSTNSAPAEPPLSSWMTTITKALASRTAELLPPNSAGAFHRILTLNEGFDENGRLIQTLGTADVQPGANADGLPYYGRGLESPATEYMAAGATEIWEIYNLTGDSHPIHFHLVNVQIIERQPFSDFGVFTGPARKPDANERGWKETVRMNPGEVIRVIAKFDLPDVPFAVPSSPRVTASGDKRLEFSGTPPGVTAHEYVWHCHILEHEEHDMMRPMVVFSNT
jgi:spore coat protein A